MKFCPKCSLKIKGNLSHCPICRVELLSYAEDEIPASLTDINESEDSSARDGLTNSPTESIPTIPPLINDKQPVTNTRTEATGHAFESRLEKLEQALFRIEGTLKTLPNQGDTIEVATCEPERRTNNIDQCLSSPRESSFALYKHYSALEKELSKLGSRVEQLFEEITILKTNLREQITTTNNLSEACNLSIRVFEEMRENLEKLEERIEQYHSLTQGKSSPPTRAKTTDLQEEPNELRRPLPDVFDLPGEPSLDVLPEEDSSLFPRRKKPSSPYKLSVILLVLIVSALLAVYYKSHYSEKVREPSPLTSNPTPSLYETNLLPSPKESKQDSVSSLKNTIPSLPGESSPHVPLSMPPHPEVTKAAKGTQTVPPLSPATYTINVGSFRDKEMADNLTKKLREKGYPVLIHPSADQRWFKVRVGTFASAEEARSFAKVLEKKEGLSTYITQIK